MDFMRLYGTASVPPAKEDLPLATSERTRRHLKAEIKRRVQWLSDDCSTFWRVRLEQTKWYNENKSTESEAGLGGGNFVMALAMLSACNFLAKAHSMLVKPDAFVTEDDRTKIKSARTILKTECPDLKALLRDSKTDWRPQPKGSCNETEAFGRLIRALHNDGIDFGLPADEAESVWRRFRNKLAHMAHPQGIVEVSAADHGKPLKEARGAIKNSSPAFRIANGAWVCNADRLSIDLLEVSEWLCKKVDECGEQAYVNNMAEWMFEQIDLLPLDGPDD